MLLSVVTVCYNAVNTIENCMRSVDIQLGSALDFEHIIVDGASTDGTIEIINSHAREYRKVFSEPDMGIYDAMNKGIIHSSGEFVMFLNADDRFYSDDVISKIIKYLKSSQSDFLCGDIVFEKRSRIIRRVNAPRKLRRSYFKLGFSPPHPACVIRKSKLVAVGGFSQSYPVCGDVDLLWRLTCQNAIYERIPMVCTIMSLGGVSTRGMSSYVSISRELVSLTAVENKPVWRFLIWARVVFKLSQLSLRLKNITTGS